MKIILTSGLYERDFKRMAKRGYDLERLHTIVKRLEQEESLPPASRPHALQGEWLGCWECHIAPNWLLIYRIAKDRIQLERSGTHADLFE